MFILYVDKGNDTIAGSRKLAIGPLITLIKRNTVIFSVMRLLKITKTDNVYSTYH